MSASPIGFTGERVVPDDCRTRDEYLMYLRHVAAYEAAAQRLAGSGRVLDVGSGEGYGGELLSAHGLDVIGLEVDPGPVARARRRYGSRRCRFVLGEGRALPFASGSFRGVLSLQVIEHVEHDGLFVHELSRVLAAGGVTVVSTPNASLRLSPGQRPWNRHHVREYRAEELASLLRNAFPSVEIWGLAASPDVQRLEANRLRRLRRIDRLDPLRLRSRLPGGLERSLRAVLRRTAAGGHRPSAASRDWEGRFAASDYSMTPEPAAALDLIAICRKSPSPDGQRQGPRAGERVEK